MQTCVCRVSFDIRVLNVSLLFSPKTRFISFNLFVYYHNDWLCACTWSHVKFTNASHNWHHGVTMFSSRTLHRDTVKCHISIIMRYAYKHSETDRATDFLFICHQHVSALAHFAAEIWSHLLQDIHLTWLCIQNKRHTDQALLWHKSWTPLLYPGPKCCPSTCQQPADSNSLV